MRHDGVKTRRRAIAISEGWYAFRFLIKRGFGCLVSDVPDMLGRIERLDHFSHKKISLP